MLYYTLLSSTGLFWTVTYLLIIVKCFNDKTYGMPAVSLCANISWEFVFSFVSPHFLLQRRINLIWLILDTILLYQLFLWGPAESPNLPRTRFSISLAAGLLTALSITLLVAERVRAYGDIYLAFSGNLLMSIQFIVMAYQRRSLRGQSIWIGLSKMTGTTSASLLVCLYVEPLRNSLFLASLFSLIFALDLLYILLLVFLSRSPSLVPDQL